MTFSSYMEKSLLHEEHGYYMKKDVFNAKGDFITSPEISQMFGEILGVWIVMFLEKIGMYDEKTRSIRKHEQSTTGKRLSLIEFGPGRGTLMSDVLRVLQQFNLLNGLEINFIEFSPFMRKLQQDNLTKLLRKWDYWMKFEHNPTKKNKMEKFTCEDESKFLSLRWFPMYEHFLHEDFGEFVKTQLGADQNKAPIIVIAHEFFDALPVNIFEYNGVNWCEKLVNISHKPLGQNPFEFFVTQTETENVRKILKPEETFSSEVRKSLKPGFNIEISPKSLVLVNSLSELIAKNDGALLFIDYGEAHGFSNSVRAIRNHKFIEGDTYLAFPGECDLSAYVNFAALEAAARKVPGIKPWPIIPQGLFLESMGMNTRLEYLISRTDSATTKRLESEYLRLVSPDEMGQIYKFQYIGLEKNGEIFPFIDESAQTIHY
eukprot:TRINITY_DN1114_c0_g1_i2.p1 TRINITY_DN1114_c0_g1~~TRINITY_DN1114_c0_g1_i2.p1  ORF type:complete len:431 (+),score=92.58 TRINITY_DN1114_c0_g1_i2:552-1844(+)